MCNLLWIECIIQYALPKTELCEEPLKIHQRVDNKDFVVSGCYFSQDTIGLFYPAVDQKAIVLEFFFQSSDQFAFLILALDMFSQIKQKMPNMKANMLPTNVAHNCWQNVIALSLFLIPTNLRGNEHLNRLKALQMVLMRLHR